MTNLGPLSPRQLAQRIREFPEILGELVRGLNADLLASPMREDGWTIRQMIHHLADSHVNLYTRLRFLLTEDRATIKPYDQERWAELDDARNGPVEDSLLILQGVHNRCATLMENITSEQLEKKGHHPEVGEVTVEYFARALIFHGKHHLRKITEAINTARKEAEE